MNNGMALDASQFNKMVDNLTGKDMKKAMVSALRKSGNILKKETDSQFRSHINIGKISSKKTTKNGFERNKWVKIATVKIEKKKLLAKVHIMADFRSKFFEIGTKGRVTKGRTITGEYRKGARKYLKRSGRGGYRGKVNAGRYFRKAQDITERKIFSEMDQLLSEAILKLGNKK